MRTILVFVAILISLTGLSGYGDSLSAQHQQSGRYQDASLKEKAAIFQDVERSLLTGNVNLMAKHFAKNISISLRDGESGFFSANQAFYVLQNYLRTRRVITFRLSTAKYSGEMPYATGGGTVVARGKQEPLQIYVALLQVENSWLIAQFNAY